MARIGHGWMGWGIALAAIVGCSDYELGSKPDAATAPDSGLPPVTTSTPVPPPPPPPLTCATYTDPAWTWLTGAPFGDEADPVDAYGAPFWAAAHDRSRWTAVTLPHLDVPVGQDRVYAGSWTWDTLPANLTLELESDDGIWLWVNERYVGHWGGDWQEEGCVNEHANCLVTTAVGGVDVTPYLVEGDNLIAARVSNAISNAYFEVVPGCVDAR